MTSPIPFSTEHLDGCETELRTALPELYSDPAEREIVERVLIAQLRAVLGKTVAEVTLPLAARDIHDLCASVDGALAEHKDLLDTDGILLPAMPKINEVRQRVRAELEENFKAACRAALAEHKVYDRTALLYRGSNWFKKCNFFPFGKAGTFASKILGKRIKDFNQTILEEIADHLNLPLQSVEQARVYREALAQHRIVDREILLQTSACALSKMIFTPWGGGAAFVSEILGEPLGNLNLSVRRRVADRVGFQKPSPEKLKAQYRLALAKHKVYDRTALYYRGPNWFRRTNFPPFGSGKVFARKILEKTYIRSISNRTLQEIADQLDLPEHSEIQIQVYREALAAHDIIDHETLLLVHDDQLMKMTFPPWGRFSAFFSEILGESCGSNINSSLRHCIADRVGFSQLTSEERTMRYREALAAHSIHDRNELHAIGLKGYAGMDFLRYGKCYSFFGIVLRKTVRVITHALLDELADALGW